MSAAKDMQPIGQQEMQSVPAGPESIMAVISRAASDPTVDVDKLERLMAMYERLTAKQAEAAFNAAMTDAQIEMRPIAADMENKQTHSMYASYAALDKKLRPIYTAHGFSMSFDEGESPADFVNMLCYVSHKAGHSRTYRKMIPADGKGAKGGDVMTKTHASGAATQYGMRYITKMVWNVSIGEDDDGNGATAGQEKITEDQANTINAKITDNELDMGRFLAWLRGAPIKAASIPDINAKSYDNVISALDASIKKKVAK